MHECQSIVKWQALNNQHLVVIYSVVTETSPIYHIQLQNLARNNATKCMLSKMLM